MKKTPCIYAIVRFRPFVETGEFANVGVVLIAPDKRYFGYKLLINRHARVTHFFEQLEAKVYKATMRHLEEELERARGVLMHAGFDRRLKSNDPVFAQLFFAEITRARETVIQFGEQRAILVEEPAKAVADLFDYYVERNFVTREYQEAVMERGLRRWLYKADLADRFGTQAIGDDVYHVNFPFVELTAAGRNPPRAIKPLNLAQDQPNKILDHGGQWIFRIEQLRKRNRLPGKVLFAVNADLEANTPRYDAFNEVVGALKMQDGVVVERFDRDPVLRFATDMQ